MKFNLKDLLLLLAFLLVSVAASAQSINYDGNKFFVRGGTNVDARQYGDTAYVYRMNLRDSVSGGYMIVSGTDTSVMFLDNDTFRVSTTASAFRFKPALPCCEDTCLFEVGAGANSVQDKRSPNGAEGNETTVVGVLCLADSTSQRSNAIGYDNDIINNSYRSNAIGYDNDIYNNCYYSNAIGNFNSIGDSSYFSSAIGNGNFIIQSRLSIAIADSAEINNKPKSIALGIRAAPTDSNQLAISDSIKTVLLKLNVATAGAGSMLTVDANGIATWSNRALSGSATLNFGSIGNHGYEDLTITVTGASDGDVVSIGAPNGSVPANASFFAWVSATNTVTVRCFNINSGSIDPASGTFKIKVFK